jgi:hypothetical protein
MKSHSLASLYAPSFDTLGAIRRLSTWRRGSEKSEEQGSDGPESMGLRRELVYDWLPAARIGLGCAAVLGLWYVAPV